MISTLYLCLETPFSQGFAQIRITLSLPASPPSPPPRYPADGGVTEVVAAVPKEVCGVSVKEVSHSYYGNFYWVIGFEETFGFIISY